MSKVILRRVTSARNEPTYFRVEFAIESQVIYIASVHAYHWAERLAQMVASEHNAEMDNRVTKEAK